MPEKLTIKLLNELMLKEYPPQRWVVEKLIPQGGLVMMSASPASYKTWLMLQVALSVAKGEKFIDAFHTEQTKVLIMDEESGERSLQERFRRLGATSTLPIHYLSRAGRKASEEYAKQVISVCKENEIGLVMFDSFIRFAIGSENDSTDMSRNMDNFKKITDQGIACLILHHNRKAGLIGSGAAESMRGSGDILAACDVHVALRRKGDKITISQTKNRYCQEIEPQTLKFVSKGERSQFLYLGKDKTRADWDEELKREIVRYIEDCPGVNKSEILRDFQVGGENLPANRAHKLLNELSESGQIISKRGDKNAKLFYVADNAGDTYEEESEKE